MVRGRLGVLILAVVVALALTVGVMGYSRAAVPVKAASYGTYPFHTAVITASGAGSGAPWIFGVDEMDVFAMVDLGTGITQAVVHLETSYDGAHWTGARDAADSPVALTFTADGTQYVTLDPVPGLYLRAYIDITGTGAVTPTVKGVGRVDR